MKWLINILSLCFIVGCGGRAIVDIDKTPDPTLSTFSKCLVVSPNNSKVPNPFEFVGYLKDANEQPIVGFDLNQISLVIQNSLILHPEANSDANGKVKWNKNILSFGGGIYNNGNIVVQLFIDHNFCFDVVREFTFVASPDYNGNNVLDLTDLSKFQDSFFNPSDDFVVSDYDCDGMITLKDVSLFQEHFFTK